LFEVIDLRCSAADGEATPVRCQLLAGHGRVHAAMIAIDGHRRIVTWTATSPASAVASLPADAATASSFAWSIGCPRVELSPEAEAAAADARTTRRRRHLRVVA
jgi:hypothetical protein